MVDQFESLTLAARPSLAGLPHDVIVILGCVLANPLLPAPLDSFSSGAG